MSSDGAVSEHRAHRPEAPQSQLYVEAAACGRPVHSVSRDVCVSKVRYFNSALDRCNSALVAVTCVPVCACCGIPLVLDSHTILTT
jgi:hypothetical protein